MDHKEIVRFETERIHVLQVRIQTYALFNAVLNHRVFIQDVVLPFLSAIHLSSNLITTTFLGCPKGLISRHDIRLACSAVIGPDSKSDSSTDCHRAFKPRNIF
jgi:hypothetical protein